MATLFILFALKDTRYSLKPAGDKESRVSSLALQQSIEQDWIRHICSYNFYVKPSFEFDGIREEDEMTEV